MNMIQTLFVVDSFDFFLQNYSFYGLSETKAGAYSCPRYSNTEATLSYIGKIRDSFGTFMTLGTNTEARFEKVV